MDESRPSLRRGRKRSGSLAEVNLEPISPREHEGYSTGRRGSKIDTCDLDIFGHRSSGNQNPSSRTVDCNESSQPTGRVDDTLTNKDIGNRPFPRQEFDPPFRREGRRPSLAELVTIYELSQDVKIPKCEIGAD